MALIKCNECGNDMSDKAMVCPHCGNPNPNASVINEEINSEKKKVNKKQVTICVVAVIAVIAIVCIIFAIKNKKSPIEKIIYEDYQVLKEEMGDNISLQDALYFKRTSKDGEVWYEVLLVYKSHGKLCYAGFNDDGEYLGNGDEYVNSSNPDMNVAWNNFTVSIMIIEYEQYAEGSTKLLYSENSFEDVVDENEAGDKDMCVVAVSVDKIK